METVYARSLQEGVGSLETFLVEWKRSPISESILCRPLLETFLVEWKLAANPTRTTGYFYLETFLVEWKRGWPPMVLLLDRPLKPS